MKKNLHWHELNKSYQQVAECTRKNRDLLSANLNESRNLFTNESVISRKPIPKDLEVFALLSGLPFQNQFINELLTVQSTISEILGNTLHYCVKPENFGVEHCVFKWPWDTLDSSTLLYIRKQILSLKISAFDFDVIGVQLNPDGCIVAKGFDEGASITSIRRQLLNSVPSLPKKQSGWAHIPMGRVLEPLGEKKFAKLLSYLDSIANNLLASQKITSLRLVHETQWYMETHQILETHEI